jgi:hypothetical protein
MRQTVPRSSNKRYIGDACQCRKRGNSKIYLQWPFWLARTHTSIHKPHCPHATYEDSMIDLSLRFSVCRLALKRKIQLAFALSRNAGSTTIRHSLRTIRIVDSDAPAFKLAMDIRTDLSTNLSPDAWEKHAYKLYRLFEQRLASPHDQLANGQTLVHVYGTYQPIHDHSLANTLQVLLLVYE